MKQNSLLTTSATRRVTVALAMIAVLWLGVAWAMATNGA